MTEPTEAAAIPAQVEQLQEVRPVWELQGHELCADVHIALSVAEAVLTSRRERVSDLRAAGTADDLLRELRALGVQEASPQTVAMVALVETAIGQLAETGAMTEPEAWEALRTEVLSRHCQSPGR